MRLSLDPKPMGAFIEYTIKPLIDDSRELLDVAEKHGVKLGDFLDRAYRLYIVDCIVRTLTTLTATGMICYTVLHCLSTPK